MTILWPLSGRITSHYGDTKNRARPHTGTDIYGSTGSMIRAGADGYVHLVGDWAGSPNAGKVVTVIYGAVMVIYCHSDGEYKVKRGDAVRAGTDLVAVGTTGTSRGGHTHIEVFVNGVRVNPEHYLGGVVLAGGDLTPTPKTKPERRNTMTTLFQHQGKTLFALAGDSPGTEANWQETTGQPHANDLARVHGNAVVLSAGTWTARKRQYLAPVKTTATLDSAAIAKAVADAVTAALANLPTGTAPTAAQNAAEVIRQMKLPGN